MLKRNIIVCIIVSHSPLRLLILNRLPLRFTFPPNVGFAPTFLPSSNLPESLVHILCIKLCHFINDQFSIDSFLDWEGHRWVLAYLNQTAVTHSLLSLCRITIGISFISFLM